LSPIRIIEPKIPSGISILILLLVPLSAFSERSSTYVGWTRCAVCHSDIAGIWQNSRHAKAIESLKKSKQENLPGCVKCHVTGYEQDGGFLDYELTPEMAGVQCEECHGPGDSHVNNSAGEPVKSKVPGVEICRKCHTAGQDPGFSYEKKSADVHGKKQGGP
jgi:hypothetical protein